MGGTGRAIPRTLYGRGRTSALACAPTVVNSDTPGLEQWRISKQGGSVGLLCRVGVLRRTTRAHRVRRGAAAAAPAPNSVPSAHWQTDAIGAPPARTHRPLQPRSDGGARTLTSRISHADSLTVYLYTIPNTEHRTLNTEPYTPIRLSSLLARQLYQSQHTTRWCGPAWRPWQSSGPVHGAGIDAAIWRWCQLSRVLVVVCRHEADKAAGAGRGWRTRHRARQIPLPARIRNLRVRTLRRIPRIRIQGHVQGQANDGGGRERVGQ